MKALDDIPIFDMGIESELRLDNKIYSKCSILYQLGDNNIALRSLIAIMSSSWLEHIKQLHR